MKKLYTAEEVKAIFKAEGVSLTEWAKTNGFPRSVVYAVVNGKSRGDSGEAHHVAVALGMKPRPTGHFARLDDTLGKTQLSAPQQDKPALDTSRPSEGNEDEMGA